MGCLFCCLVVPAPGARAGRVAAPTAALASASALCARAGECVYNSRMIPLRTFRLLASAALVALIAACATNPVTGNREVMLMSEQEEIAAGNDAAKQVAKEYQNYDLPALQGWVNEVGQRLAAVSHRAQLKYTFTVVDSAEVNAFALPGGHIYITRGILAYLNSESELAGVLGHEIGHVTARHSARQQTQGTLAGLGALVLGSALEIATGVSGFTDALGTGATAYVRGYGRDNELEADRLGAEYLARAGYDPQAMIRVVNVLKNQELFDVEVAQREGRDPRRFHSLFDTHPDSDRRLREVVGAAKNFQAGNRDEGRSAYLRATAGMVFGESAEQGFVRDGVFYHPPLGIAVRFPEKWRLANRPDAVLAVSPEKDAAVQMRLGPDPSGDPAGALRQLLKPDRVIQSETLNIAGLPAARLVGAKQQQVFQVTGIDYQDHLVMFIGLGSDAQALARHQATISQAAGSFHPMSAEQRRNARPRVIRTVTARAGDTYASLAKGSPLGSYAEQYLRLINGRYPSGEPAAGEPVKVVE